MRRATPGRRARPAWRRCSWGSTAASARWCSISSKARRRMRCGGSLPPPTCWCTRCGRRRSAGSALATPTVREKHPRLVYAALHGYRDGGPYSGQPAYDDVIQGQSGIAALMAQMSGEPRYAPMILADKTCALAIAGAVCAALFERERTGRGRFVEIPMFEQMVAFVLGEHLFGHNFVPPLGPLGYTRVTAPWRRPYQTKDGYLCMMAYTQAHWRKFWTAVGKPEMLSDPRFDTIASRADNVVALYELAGACIADKTTDEWLETAARAGNPGGADVEPRRSVRRSAACGDWLFQARDASERGRNPVHRTAGAVRRRQHDGRRACSRGSASTVSRCCARPASPRPRSTRSPLQAPRSAPAARRRRRSRSRFVMSRSGHQ